MKKSERVTANVLADKRLIKGIESVGYYSAESFINDAERFVKATKEGRLINSIGSVSKSGMSRTLKMLECSGSPAKGFRYYQFWAMFKALGYTPARSNDDFFTVNCCGMDMVFHTHYSIIHKFERLGFIDRKTCDTLAQRTPTTI